MYFSHGYIVIEVDDIQHIRLQHSSKPGGSGRIQSAETHDRLRLKSNKRCCIETDSDRVISFRLTQHC